MAELLIGLTQLTAGSLQARPLQEAEHEVAAEAAAAAHHPWQLRQEGSLMPHECKLFKGLLRGNIVQL